MPELVGRVVPVGRLRDLEQPTFQIDELTLRPFHARDVADLVEAYQDSEIQRWHARSMTGAEAMEWIMASASGWNAETKANWAITDAGRLVGRVGLPSITLSDGIAEIGYWTTPQARGRNIAPRGLRVVSAWLFRQVGLHRLELNHSIGNAASCRVADKAGFTYEGTRRQHGLHHDGWHDMHVHGRLANDELANEEIARAT